MRQCPKCGKRFLADQIKVCDEDGAALESVVVASDRDRLVGAVVGDRYRIEGVLGDGGMGVVYRATGLKDGKSYAVKVLRSEYSSDVDLVVRFEQEARSAAEIHHPNIVRVFEFAALPDDSRYFVMEYLEGKSLGRLLADQGRSATPGRRRPLPEALTIHIARQLCDGLAAAHARGIVHRDMKPDNVHLIRQGSDAHFVKILDFGIAKVQNAQSTRTRTGSVFGTPHYMSPEQAQGERDIDARTDVYALGVLMYEMATGRVPFDADNMMGVLTAHLYHPPLPPRQTPDAADLSEGLEAIILKALVKRREGRYLSMAEMGEDLARVAEGESPLALLQAEPVTSKLATPAGPLPPNLLPRTSSSSEEPRVIVRDTPGTGVRAAAPDPVLAAGAAIAPEVRVLAQGATGRSIPPVTGSTGSNVVDLPARGLARPSMLIATFMTVGVAAFGAAGMIALRRSEPSASIRPSTQLAAGAVSPPRPAPAAPIQPVVPSSATAIDAPVVPTAGTGSTLQLRSEPEGATVYLGRRRVGLTPLAIARPAAGAATTYTVAADGHARATVVVRADTPAEVQVSLPARRPDPRGSAPSRGGGSGNSTGRHSGAAQSGHSPLLDPWATESRRR